MVRYTDVLSRNDYEMPKMQKPENNQERQEEGQIWLPAALSLQGLQERVR
jgi:hypothetical protein